MKCTTSKSTKKLLFPLPSVSRLCLLSPVPHPWVPSSVPASRPQSQKLYSFGKIKFVLPSQRKCLCDMFENDQASWRLTSLHYLNFILLTYKETALHRFQLYSWYDYIICRLENPFSALPESPMAYWSKFVMQQKMSWTFPAVLTRASELWLT